MENKVEYSEYCKAKNEMRAELNAMTQELFSEKYYHNLVEVYADFGYKRPIKAEVNWAALGSVSAEDAVKFAQLLTKAAELASNFKYNGFKVYYTDED